jgi:hypothetical protein
VFICLEEDVSEEYSWAIRFLNGASSRGANEFTSKEYSTAVP